MEVTVNYGLDLGTTNSVLAVRDPSRVTVIPNSDGALMTPSAVHIDAAGTVYVGRGAKERAYRDKDNTAIVFKRLMGRGVEAAKHFKANGRRLLPEELSAEVLKSLRADARDKRGEEIREIVITVPADFDAGQNQATVEAALKYAGFQECTLLQEPIAAALAYAMKEAPEVARWLIYDFGGGTFDAAIIRFDEGEPSVENHAGNNYLGGSDIDKAIVSQKLVPKLRRNNEVPSGFDPDDAFWSEPVARMLQAAEKAKIQVCRTRGDVRITETLGNDLAGREMMIDYKLTPVDVAEITLPYVAQSLELCRKALADKNLSPANIDKVLMVGGTTLNPWVREEVQRELGRPIEIGIDPMTVVAEGAAIFAGTLNRKHQAEGLAEGAYHLEVRSPLSANDSPVEFVALLHPPAEPLAAGLSVEFVRTDGRWRSGAVPVRAGGIVRTNLRLSDSDVSTYATELRAADGTLLTCAPEQITISRAAVPEIPLTHNFGVGLANGRLDVLLRKGTPLPAKANCDPSYRTVVPLQPGDAKSEIVIPFYEGPNEERAIRNRLLFELKISGADVDQHLPVGSEVDITLTCDANAQLKAVTFFPRLGREFPASIELDRALPRLDYLRSSFSEQQARVAKLREQAAGTTDERVSSALARLDGQGFSARIAELLTAGAGPDALLQADRWVRDFAEAIDVVEDALLWPTTVSDAEKALETCRKAVEKSDIAEHKQRFSAVERDLRAGIASGQPHTLRLRVEAMRRLTREAEDRNLIAVAGWFLWLKEQRGTFTDPQTADALIARGDRALDAQDRDSLIAIRGQLIGLLPPSVNPLTAGPGITR